MPTPNKNVVTLTAHDGSVVKFVNEIKGQGGIKDCYFSPDRSYVVLFFRDKVDVNGRDRLTSIVGRYRNDIFGQIGGEYWKKVFCWPEKIVEWDGRLGLVAPVYAKQFFFEYGSRNNDMLKIAGREKEGKWFASAKLRSKRIDPRELGSWATHLRICLHISRAVRRMHMAGLAHSDLSYKNVLVDPAGGNACIIDIDGLVVPGKFPPDVVGTPDFIAPEVVATRDLKVTDAGKKLPNIQTDCHALAVLIYLYLLYRHPLRGRKVHDIDDELRDEALRMGDKALFVEDPKDTSNRINIKEEIDQMPWVDTAARPYTLTGPYLAPLILRAFTDGLRDPSKRPSANEWENALIRTTDLLQPCSNPSCEQKWYVFDSSTRPQCPFCGTVYKGKLPILNLYYSHKQGKFINENRRLMVYADQSIYPWHVNRNVAPNEKLTVSQSQRAGYFLWHNHRWLLVNERMPDLYNASTNTAVPIGDNVELMEGLQLLLSREEGGRLVHVQLVDAA